MTRFSILAVLLTFVMSGCQEPPAAEETCGDKPAQGEGAATSADVEGARKFMEELETELLDLWIAEERLAWINATNLTHDTDLMAARGHEQVMEYVARKAEESTKFDGVDLPEDLARKMKLLKLSLSMPAPADDKLRKELAEIGARMKSRYGKGKYCTGEGDDEKCRTLGELSKVMATSDDYDELLDAWSGWRTTSRASKDDFARFVELANEGSQELGFDDLGALWSSRYDMPPQQFQQEIEKLWTQVKPLYDQLHCYVRTNLSKKYGEERVPAKGPIPAHLLGNMWSQEWGALFDEMAPEKDSAFDFSSALVAKGYDERAVVKQAERFFVSLGLDPLPETFWERSMFTKPRDREVVCHASAWAVDWKDDLRIKMCIKVDAEDFTVIHHELGHNYYQRAYNHLPTLFTNSANDGFHEALGDTIALSVTPSSLKDTGIIDELPKENLNQLMERALDKIAFLPFGFVVDRWRLDVFSGKVKPADYNAHWWKLRTEYQGIEAPVERGAGDFDPGAKYHVPANVPYTRYFLAAILQYQFHRGLCKVAGHEGPLHKCSIYDNKEAGARLNEMMKMGAEKPWPEALEALTGEREMDASAIIDYYAPLIEWLEEQNKDAQCGW